MTVVRRVLLGSLPVVVLALAWEAFARSGAVTAFVLPPLSAVIARIGADAASGELAINIGVTLFRALLAIYAGLGTFVEVETAFDALTMVASIMGGSFLYWFVVSERIALIRHRLDHVQLGRINALAGLILIGFGALLIADVFWRRLIMWAIALLFWL